MSFLLYNSSPNPCFIEAKTNIFQGKETSNGPCLPPSIANFLALVFTYSYWITCDFWICFNSTSVTFGKAAPSIQEELFTLSCLICTASQISDHHIQYLLQWHPKAYLGRIVFHISLTPYFCLYWNTSHDILSLFSYLFLLYNF